MYEKLFSRLFYVENHILIFFGKNSLDRLVWFIQGYLDANYDPITRTRDSFMNEFEIFAEDKLKIKEDRMRGWQYYLEKKYGTESKEAVDVFYKLLHDYYEMLVQENKITKLTIPPCFFP